MMLAPNFSLHEMARTSHRRYLASNYTEAQKHLAPLTATAEMLQVVRDHYGSPVVVHSGFRSKVLNTAIGGSRYSQHMKGEAADFHVVGVPLPEVWRWVWQGSGLRFGQLILEGWSHGAPSWIHLSLGEPWRPADRSRQVLTWDNDNGYRRVG